MFDAVSVRSKKSGGLCLRIRKKRRVVPILLGLTPIDRSALGDICVNTQECIGVF